MAQTHLRLVAMAALACLAQPPAAHAAPLSQEDDQAPAPEAFEPAIVDLGDALRLAYDTSPALMAERMRAAAAGYRVPQARAGFGPTLTYEGRYGYENDRVEAAGVGTFSTRSGWSSSAAAVLTQPLYSFGRNASGLKAAKAAADYAEAVLKNQEAQLFLDVLTSYASVIRDRKAVEISEQYLDVLGRERRDNAARFAKREATATDVQQAATRLELGRQQLLAARQQMANSEAGFVAVVGRSPGALASPEPLVVPLASLEAAQAMAEQRNPVVVAARARERASRAQEGAARAEFLPRVDLRGVASYGSVTPYSDSLRQRGLTGQVVLSGTLFDSGLRRARLHEADAANEADWRLIDATVRDTRRQMAEAWNAWVSQRAAVERLEIGARSAQQALDGAIVQERAGLRTSLEVLDLARDLLLARSTHNAAIAAAYVAQARVIATAGLVDFSLLSDPERGAERRVQPRRGGGLFPISPLLEAIDGVVTGNTTDRHGRDDPARVAGPAADTAIDTTGDPVGP